MEQMETMESIEENLQKSLALLKEAIDLSVSILQEGHNKKVSHLWEENLGQFIKYVKLKGKESKIHLASEISIWKLLK